jgi:hypothetical protein
MNRLVPGIMERNVANPLHPVRIVFVALAALANAAILTGVGSLADHYYASTRIAATVVAHARAANTLDATNTCDSANTLDAMLPASSNRQPIALPGDDAECNAGRSS